jgi:chemotaxis methyl-accepting protein methylase
MTQSNLGIHSVDSHPIEFADLESDKEGFLQITKILSDWIGVSMPLNPKNQSLVSSRLLKFFPKWNVRSYGELATLLKNPPDAVKVEFISALTTHTTHFFGSRITLIFYQNR